MKTLKESLMDDIDVQVKTATKDIELRSILTNLCTCKSDDDFVKYMKMLPEHLEKHNQYKQLKHMPYNPKDGFYAKKIDPDSPAWNGSDDIELVYVKNGLLVRGVKIYIYYGYKTGQPYLKSLKSWHRGYTYLPGEQKATKSIRLHPAELLYYCGDDPTYKSLWDECVELAYRNVLM